MSEFQQFNICGWLCDGMIERFKGRQRTFSSRRRQGAPTAAVVALSLIAAVGAVGYATPAASQVQATWGNTHWLADAEPEELALIGSPETYWPALTRSIASWSGVAEPAADLEEIPPFL